MNDINPNQVGLGLGAIVSTWVLYKFLPKFVSMVAAKITVNVDISEESATKLSKPIVSAIEAQSLDTKHRLDLLEKSIDIKLNEAYIKGYNAHRAEVVTVSSK